jgi:hypothetical protein
MSVARRARGLEVPGDLVDCLSGRLELGRPQARRPIHSARSPSPSTLSLNPLAAEIRPAVAHRSIFSAHAMTAIMTSAHPRHVGLDDHAASALPRPWDRHPRARATDLGPAAPAPRRVALTRTWRKEPAPLRDDARRVAAHPRLKYREIVTIVHGRDPHFALKPSALIPIEDPIWVSADPTFAESFCRNTHREDPPIYLALRFAPGLRQ